MRHLLAQMAGPVGAVWTAIGALVRLFARRSPPSDEEGPFRSWLAPPSEPLHYRLRHRLRDARQGRRDGKLAVPKLDDLPAADGEDSPTDPTPAPVETAYLKELCRCFEEQVAEERLAHHRDTASLDRRLAASVTTANTLARAVEMASVRLDEVSKPLAEELMDVRSDSDCLGCGLGAGSGRTVVAVAMRSRRAV